LQIANQQLISFVEADQLIKALLGDRLTAGSVQNFIANRVTALSMGNYNLTQNGYSGIAAGEAPGGRVGIWADVAHTWLEDNRLGGAQEGDAQAAAFGADYQFQGGTIGAFISYGDTDISGGGSSFGSDGWSGGIYGNILLGSTVRLTGTLGTAKHDVAYTRTQGALISIGETERSQTFGAVSLESQHMLSRNLVAVPSVGVFLSSSTTDAYTDRAGRAIAGQDTDFSVATVGSAFYLTGGKVLPYATVAWNQELKSATGSDEAYARFGLGVAIPFGGGADFTVGGQVLAFKRGERETSVGLTLRKRF